jgi:endonuclease G
MTDLDARLEALISTLDTADGPLAAEIRALRDSRSLASRDVSPSRRTRSSLRQSLRNIVLRVGRPVLTVLGGRPKLAFRDVESEIWRARLTASADRLQAATRAVGRINVRGVPQGYVGTGWLVDKNIVVTNRHVAQAFGGRRAGRLPFRRSGATPVDVSIDFLEEAGRRQRLAFQIVEIVHMEEDDGPDFVLLRVDEASNRRQLPAPIRLASTPARPEQQVAVIGYPARDSRVPDRRLMQSIFGNVYDKKRLAPGQVNEARPDLLLHDCSTLGGNSGSVVVDLTTGEAVGLHCAGRFLETNYAVPAGVLAARMEQLRRPRPPVATSTAPQVRPPSSPVLSPATQGWLTEQEPILEGVPEDYVGRRGYDPQFLGKKVPLPVIRDKADILMFPWSGAQAFELKYQHFSVVMSRSRRLCIFSAVNIDGSAPRRAKRPAWRLDPRIPSAQQIRDECYGNAPLFARGHMTRREDPIWGEPADAELGNSDSMHVTNTVPQMQPFNAGIWLGLESYALEHARTDQMKISVFTGPFLQADDPVRAGVRIPRVFWKVIAFLHDETRALCASGYTMSQEEFLRDDEFVFGKHLTSQVPLATIEQSAGLSFGRLTALDAFGDEEATTGRLLTDPAQIRFRRRER